MAKISQITLTEFLSQPSETNGMRGVFEREDGVLGKVKSELVVLIAQAVEQ